MECEKAGLPSVTLISTPFVPLARTQSRILGVPSLATVVLEHPIAGTPLDSVLAKVDAALDEIVARLTGPLAAAPEVAQASAEWIDLAIGPDFTDAQQALFAQGWTDGLPAIPPTEERIRAMLAFTDGPRDRVAGIVAPRMGAATLEVIAANAVMAGCRPAHMPVLVAAVEAMADPSFNLYGVQCTTHCVAPLMIVNGPLAAALGIHAGNNLFGPGPWQNGVIGRALRFILLNVGGGKPGEIDKATMGHPGKYTFCIAEKESASPWSSLRAERGFDAGTSTVTMVGGEAPHNINDHESTTGGGLITMIVNTVAQTGQNNVYYDGEPLLVLSPEHAATLAGDGFSKDDVKQRIYEEARVPLYKFSRENVERRFPRKFPQRFKDRSLDTLVPVAQCWEDVMVIVAGGPGKHSMYIPTFGGTRSVTRAIARADGKPYLPGDFK